MPTYSEISEEILKGWFESINILCFKLKRVCDIDLLCYLFLRLYEYLQCYSKLYNSDFVKLVNVKATLSDVKKKVNDDSFFSVINLLYGIRNDVGHCYYQSGYKKIYAVVRIKEFPFLLSEFGFSEDFVNTIISAVKQVGCKERLSSSCREDCKKVILAITDKGISLNSVFSRLYSRYPKSIVDETMISLLGSHTIVS